MSSEPEHRGFVVVTGTSTGIGAATALHLADKGFHVLAGVRREADGDALQAQAPEQLTPLIIEVTDEDDDRGGGGRGCRCRGRTRSGRPRQQTRRPGQVDALVARLHEAWRAAGARHGPEDAAAEPKPDFDEQPEEFVDGLVDEVFHQPVAENA